MRLNFSDKACKNQTIKPQLPQNKPSKNTAKMSENQEKEPCQNKETWVTLDTIQAAASRLNTALAHVPTSLKHCEGLSKLLGMNVYVKCEFEHVTGSFKERGVCNALMRMSALNSGVSAQLGKRARGAIAASAGNHALALSYYGFKLHVPVTVVMPHVVPHHKVDWCQAHGARVLIYGDHYGDSVQEALRLAHYDNMDVVSGAGTISVELMRQAQEMAVHVDAIVVPVGGAGLLAGVAVAAKGLDQGVTIVAAEPTAAASMHAALQKHAPVTVDVQPTETLADVLVVPRVGDRAFSASSNLVTNSVTVTDDWVKLAMHLLHAHAKVKVEGAGATALAALLAGGCDQSLRGRNVVVIASGGNIADEAFQRAIAEGAELEKSLMKGRCL